MNPGWCGKTDKRLDALEGQLVEMAREVIATGERVADLTPEGFATLRAEILGELEGLRAFVKRATGRKK